MRFLLILVLFGCFVLQASSRPPRMNDGNNGEVEETEYEGGGNGADNLVQEDDESRSNEQEPEMEGPDEEAPDQRLQDTSGRTEQTIRAVDNDHSGRASNENLPEFKSDGNSDDEKLDESDNEYQSVPEPRQSNRYLENNDPNDQQSTRPLTSRDDDFKLVYDSQNKKNLEPRTTSNEEGDFLFENNANSRKQFVKDQMRYNNDASDPSEQSRYYKQYYNTMQAENRGNYANAHINLNRDRRQAQQSLSKENQNLSTSPKLKENSENNAPEDEEAAIKKHVKKLSGEELQEILNSLSEEKRELLKKIMESDADSNSDIINKREITKKAGAVEENSFMETGQSDASKLQSGGDINSDSSANSVQETSKQPDINDFTVTKTLEVSNSSASTANKSESTAHVDESSQGKSESILNAGPPSVDSKNEANFDSTTKTENKREANFNNLSDIEPSFDEAKFENDYSIKDLSDPSNDEGYLCSQNEDMSHLTDDESNNGNTFKREAILESESDFSDSIKSLEESFPNSNSYDESDPYFGSDMAPLVRVKRKNEDVAVKKRAAALLPDSKVAFFPYRAENDDEDNDEGNEFDDEGFYDRTSNIAKINANDKPEKESSNNFDSSVHFYNRNHQSDFLNSSKLAQEDNLESETMSLGSDTDNVLSGVEGVDENLMYNTGARNRRTADDTKEQPVKISDIKLNRALRSTPLIDDELKSVSENYINAPHYHENDAFGPLPRNYEGELGRYKRIRRVKQPSASPEVSST